MANIGIVTTWFERGAAYVSRAYMETLSRFHKVFIYARGGEEYAKGDPAWDLDNVTWAPRLNGLARLSTTAVSMPHFYRWLVDKSIDVIIFNEQIRIDVVREATSLGYTTGAYIDYYTHRTVPEFNIYDFLLCNTRRHHSVFKDHPNALFIPWGTDTDLFKPQRYYPERTGRKEVVFFHSAGWGGRNLRKGTDLLIRAFQNVQGPAKLLLHSQAPVSHYGEMVGFIQADSRIEFVEKTVAAPGLYHLGDIFVYPSRLEGIGLCVPEALACGLPVITTDCAPMNEFIQDGFNGMLVKVDQTRRRDDSYYWPETMVDVGDLTQKMQLFIDHPNQIEAFQRRARSNAVEQYDWFTNSADLAGMLTSMTLIKNKIEPVWKDRVRWFLRDIELYGGHYAYCFGKILLPKNVAHAINAPLRWLYRRTSS